MVDTSGCYSYSVSWLVTCSFSNLIKRQSPEITSVHTQTGHRLVLTCANKWMALSAKPILEMDLLPRRRLSMNDFYTALVRRETTHIGDILWIFLSQVVRGIKKTQQEYFECHRPLEEIGSGLGGKLVVLKKLFLECLFCCDITAYKSKNNKQFGSAESHLDFVIDSPTMHLEKKKKTWPRCE